MTNKTNKQWIEEFEGKFYEYLHHCEGYEGGYEDVKDFLEEALKAKDLEHLQAMKEVIEGIPNMGDEYSLGNPYYLGVNQYKQTQLDKLEESKDYNLIKECTAKLQKEADRQLEEVFLEESKTPEKPYRSNEIESNLRIAETICNIKPQEDN